jgi:hypothetical protein
MNEKERKKQKRKKKKERSKRLKFHSFVISLLAKDQVKTFFQARTFSNKIILKKLKKNVLSRKMQFAFTSQGRKCPT